MIPTSEETNWCDRPECPNEISELSCFGNTKHKSRLADQKYCSSRCASLHDAALRAAIKAKEENCKRMFQQFVYTAPINLRDE